MDLKRAKKFLAAAEEALPHAEEIYETVHEWTAGDKPPPLVRESESWNKAVDPGKLDLFEALVRFLAGAMFGVDCDSDNAVAISIIDKARNQAAHPFFKVPRVDEVDAPLEDLVQALELARINAKTAQDVAERLECGLFWRIKKIKKEKNGR